MTSNSSLKMVGSVHAKVVHGRRIHALAESIIPLVQSDWAVADIGCGDGQLAALVAKAVPRLHIDGFEVSERPQSAIPVSVFDGQTIPLPDQSRDAVMFVDVLHHTIDPMVLLKEASRVARHAIIIKDHRTSRPLANPTLRLMDWVGNRPHGVVLPYNYWSESQWNEAWSQLKLRVDHYQTRLGLYPWPASWVFERGLHFVTRLTPLSSNP